jgi:hypothetical protein
MINASHYSTAALILQRFAATIPIERLEGDGAALLRYMFGWQGSAKVVNHHTRPRPHGKQLPGPDSRWLSESSKRLLRDLNQYDIKLVAEARTQFEAQHRRLRRRVQQHENAFNNRPKGYSDCTQQCRPGRADKYIGT